MVKSMRVIFYNLHIHQNTVPTQSKPFVVSRKFTHPLMHIQQF